MKKIKEYFNVFIIVLILSAIIYVAYRFNFYVWRLKHPSAPTWTYFINK